MNVAARAGPPLLAALTLLGVWEAYARASGVPPQILPPPTRIAAASLGALDVLVWHATQTVAETLAGFVLAILVATLFAGLMDVVPSARRALLPLLVASQTVPIVALAPLLVLWFGFGALPKVLVVLLVCFFPMVVAAAQGLSATDPELVKLYRTFGASRMQLFRLVRVPTALPALFAGMRIAATYSVIGAIFGEYVGAERGLGIFLQTAKNAYRTDLVFGAIGLTALLSLSLYGLVVLAERVAAPWARPTAAGPPTPMRHVP